MAASPLLVVFDDSSVMHGVGAVSDSGKKLLVVSATYLAPAETWRPVPVVLPVDKILDFFAKDLRARNRFVLFLPALCGSFFIRS